MRITLAVALVVVANLLAVFAEILLVLERYDDIQANYLLSQDIWMPLILLVWAQAILNGLGLLLFRRARSVGLGVLLGAAAAAVLFLGWLFFFVAPALA